MTVPSVCPSIKLLVLTWNVGNEEPSFSEIASWLPNGGEGLDLIVVGTQENSYFAQEYSQGPGSRRRGRYKSGMVLERRMPAASVGKSDLSTILCCGFNLLGLRERCQPNPPSSRLSLLPIPSAPHRRHEHWEHMLLQHLNGRPLDPSKPPVGAWKIRKHAVLAQMRLSVFERRPQGVTSSPKGEGTSPKGERVPPPTGPPSLTRRASCRLPIEEDAEQAGGGSEAASSDPLSSDPSSDPPSDAPAGDPLVST